MTNCLFIMEDWFLDGQRPGGSTALALGHVEMALNRFERVMVCVLAGSEKTANEAALRASFAVLQRCAWVRCVVMKTNQAQPVWKRLWQLLADPEGFRYPFLTDGGLRAELMDILSGEQVDVVCAEHLSAGCTARRWLAQYPLIYSHHDWNWKIKQRRDAAVTGGWRKQIHHWVSRRVEEGLVKAAAGCISGSHSEVADLRRLGAGQVGYFPTVYAPVSRQPALSSTPGGAVRVVHLGGMQTTANRIGLERFMTVSMPFLSETMGRRLELWVIGSLNGAPSGLQQALKQAGVICTGFVEDLEAVLRQGDIHIIPWEHNTGTRTRIPLALNFGQVVVAIRAGAACLPELVDGKNALLVEDLRAMAQAIARLAGDEGLRLRLGTAGRETFMENFTVEAQQARFEMFVKSIMTKDIF